MKTCMQGGWNKLVLYFIIWYFLLWVSLQLNGCLKLECGIFCIEINICLLTNEFTQCWLVLQRKLWISQCTQTVVSSFYGDLTALAPSCLQVRSLHVLALFKSSCAIFLWCWKCCLFFWHCLTKYGSSLWSQITKADTYCLRWNAEL